MTRNSDIKRWSTEQWEQHLGAQIKRARLRQNLTQAKLAATANISRGTLGSLEKGQGSTLSALVNVTRALGYHDWLDQFEPDLSPSPMEMLHIQQKSKPRQRASTPRTEP